MYNQTWIRKLFACPSRPVRKASARFRPRVEAMEDRVTPATFTVTNTLDNPNPGSLRWAINQANANPGADIINISAILLGGTINATRVGDNLIGPAAFAITGDLTINGPSASSSGITFGRDSAAPLMRLFTVYSGVGLTLNNLTLTGGVARGGDASIGGGGGAGMGGAIFNHGGILRLNNVTLANNAAIGGRGGSSVPNNQQAGGGSGGGPNGGVGGRQYGYNAEYNAAITSDSGGNGGFGGGGGGAGNAVGIFGLGIGNGGNGGFGGGGGTPSWTYRSFVGTDNRTYHINNFSRPGQSGFGAGQSGFSNNGSGPGATWSGGGAGMGGAIFSYNGETILHGTTLSGNSATGGGSSPSFNTLTDRVGEGMGGAVFVYNGSFRATNSTIAENAACSGFDAQQGLTDFSRGRSSGGGVYNLNGWAVFSNSTVANNRAARASAIANVGWTAGRSAAIVLDNTLVAEAPSVTVPGSRGGTLTFTFGPAVALDTLAAGSSTATARNSLATSVTAPVVGLTIVSNLMLGPLQNNGGPTRTMAPLAGSPAINAGDNHAVAPGVTTDQRGLPRISGGTVDVGAVEIQINPPTITRHQAAVTVNEGSPASNSGTFDDPEGRGTVTLTASLGTVTKNDAAGTWGWSYTPPDGPNGLTTVTITATDNGGLWASTTFFLTVVNVAPTIAISGAASVNEGATYTLTLGAVTDPGQDTVTQYRVHWGDGTSDTYTTAGAKTHVYADGPATRAITVDLVDEDGTHVNRANALSVTVNNVAPTVTLTAPPTGSIYAIGTPVTFTGQFTDPGILDTHAAQWMFDTTVVDGIVSESHGSGSVSTTHTFSAPGIYAVKLIVRDNDNGEGMADTVGGQTAVVIVYDPAAGFVTGIGWIDSPAGAYVANPSLTGRANFGFLAKYQDGNTVPSGSVQFQLSVAHFSFKSTALEWLIVSGAKARLRGTGMVNGISGYGFELTAWDGQADGGGADRFRIKIWDQGNSVVYDNQMGDADGVDPTTELGGGSIVIHRQGQPPMAAYGPPVALPDASPLTDVALRPIVDAAISRWAAASLDYPGHLNYSGPDPLSMAVSDGSLSAGGSVAITVKSALEQAADLQARVEALWVAGALNDGQANRLIKNLSLMGTDGDSDRVQNSLAQVRDVLGAGVLTQAQTDDLLYWGNL